MSKKHRGLRQLYRELMEEIRARKGVSIVFFTLRTIVLVTLVLQFLRGNYENVFLCILTLLLFLVPAFINRRFNIQLPSTLEVIILCFIFAAEILGEINAYYVKYDFWDTMLHTMNGFLAAAIGFSLVDVLNRSEKNDVQPLAAVRGHGGVLLFHDHRRFVGVCRVFCRQCAFAGHAEGHGHPHHPLCGA